MKYRKRRYRFDKRIHKYIPNVIFLNWDYVQTNTTTYMLKITGLHKNGDWESD